MLRLRLLIPPFLALIAGCETQDDWGSGPAMSFDALPEEPADPHLRAAGLLLSLNSSFAPGETSTLLVSGANPGETVALVKKPGPPGTSSPIAALGGMSLDVPNGFTISFATANSAGIATFNLPVPATAPYGACLVSQAVIKRGAGGSASVKSNPRRDCIEHVTRTQPTGGTALSLNEAHDVTVAANRTAGEITVMDVDLTLATPTSSVAATLDVGGDEPFNVVIGGDDDTAFVTLRNSAQVARVTDLHGTPTLDTIRADVDGDPTGIAISPSGHRLYVANHSAGTVSVVDAQSLAVVATVNLNQALVTSGLLGPSVSTARPGLARPWSVVVTNDGDDDDTDERVYVTEFYGQDDPSKTFAALGDAYFDQARQGVVYHFDVATHTLGSVITLSSIADVGFNDSVGNVTGCSPNQLFGIAENNGRIYVTSLCASPRGPAAGGGVNSKTKVHAVVSVIDQASLTENVSERLVLTRKFEDLYVSKATPDDASRRFPLIPNNIAFFPGSTIAYITAYGADALFRVEYKADGTLDEVGSVFANFINLGSASPPGRLPIGVAIAEPGDALVLNESTRNISFIDLGTQSVSTTVASATPPALGLETEINEGRRFFVTGLGRWSLNGQAWGSCEGCHPNGLSDNVTWFFAAGPRQTTSLDASFAPDGSQRVFNWTAIIDEMADFENNTRGISGGVGAIVAATSSPASPSQRIIFDGTKPLGFVGTNTSQVNLNGSMAELQFTGLPGVDATGAPITVQGILPDWDRIETYAATIRAPSAPKLNAADVTAGRTIFTTAGCQGCHGGENWTISERFYEPTQAVSAPGGLIDTTTYSIGTLPTGLNPPASGGTAFLRSGGAINCILRAVGTFNVAAAGVTVSERRDDMVTGAAGANGYNPPSLIGAGTAAPYFHAGNARTLEEVFSPTFEPHYRALSAVFSPTPTQIRQLSAFLSSIDDDAVTEGTSVGTITTVLCPPTLP